MAAESRTIIGGTSGPETAHALQRLTWLGDKMRFALVAAAALMMAYTYLDRVFAELPLYASDEAAYLIRALFGRQLDADPTLDPYIQGLTNSVFFAVIRVVAAASPHLLPWMRLSGLCAYLCGILLVFVAVRRRLPAHVAPAFLLLALIFPYYRFVVTALPEGWYVGLLGVIVYVTDRLYVRRPMAHALLAGALTAALALIKPHGVAIAVAFPGLAAAELLIRRRGYVTAGLRVAIFGTGFFVVGDLVQALAGVKLANPWLYFQGPLYAGQLSGEPASDAGWQALLSLASNTAGVIILASAPLAAGLWRLASQWNAKPRASRLDAAEAAFLFVLLSLAATIAMVSVFAYKVTSMGDDQVRRLWGRYFEFFVPMLWLTGAPFLLEAEARRGRVWRLSLCGLTVVGLAGLLFTLSRGVMLFPWDATALSAFFQPNLRRWNLPGAFPYLPAAVAATLIAAMLALTRARAARIWQGLFAALALISTGFDREWEGDIAPGRRQLALNLDAARALVAADPGPSAIVVDDYNMGHSSFLRLEGRTHVIMVGPSAAVQASQLARYHLVVTEGSHKVSGDGWRELFESPGIGVYQPDRQAPAWGISLVGKTLNETFPSRGVCVGNVDKLDNSQSVRKLYGWAWDSAARRPVARILLVNARREVAATGEGGLPRPDVPDARPDVTDAFVGWSADVTAISGRVDVYGVVSEGAATCPLGHFQL